VMQPRAWLDGAQASWPMFREFALAPNISPQEGAAERGFAGRAGLAGAPLLEITTIAHQIADGALGPVD
jgi:hypothetical protein